MIKYIMVNKNDKNKKILLIKFKKDLYDFGFFDVLGDILYAKHYTIYKKLKSSIQ